MPTVDKVTDVYIALSSLLLASEPFLMCVWLYYNAGLLQSSFAASGCL
jgi:hypothetical protein